MDIVERLEYQNEHGLFHAIRAGKEANLAEAAAEIGRLREALAPFAARAGKLDGKWLDHETHWSPAYGSTEITIGDLRRAARAFAKTEQPK